MHQHHTPLLFDWPIHRWVVASLPLWLLVSCIARKPSGAGDTSSLTVDEIIQRCANAYQNISTLQATGLLRDYRKDHHQVQPIRWDYIRPDHCRLQIGMDMTLVVGEHWWSYHHRSDRFKSLRQISSTPIQTAAYFLSDGIQFVIPMVLTKGKRAFHSGSYDHTNEWKMNGSAWIADRPCYAVSRLGKGPNRNLQWSVWIDQDTFLVRGWRWERLGRDQEAETVLGCTYFNVVIDKALPTDRFQMKPPTPIVLPRKGDR